MSVSHPLVTALKGSTRELLLWSLGGDTRRDIDDACVAVGSLCRDIETVLQRGLLPRHTLFGAQAPEAWHWMDSLASRQSLPYSFQSAVALARKSPKVATARGRLRLAIRACLNANCLHVPVQALLQGGEDGVLYRADSVLGDVILGEIFVSVLLQLSRLPFKLALSNARFLDTTWKLPATAQLELLPCAAIGLSLDFVDKMAVVVDVAPGSVAADMEAIEVGDVLDEINGDVITDKTRGNLKDIMRRGAKKPVLVNIVKLSRENGDLYGPLESAISSSRIADVIAKAVKSKRRTNAALETRNEKAVPRPKASVAKKPRHGLVAYLEGTVSTGRMGDIRCIEMGLDLVMAHAPNNAPRHKVTVECQEVGVSVKEAGTNKVLAYHTYMEISSCGRSPKWPLFFAYIAGDDNANCNRATKFTCYVFSAHSPSEVDDLLLSIGQGFNRTHFAV